MRITFVKSVTRLEDLPAGERPQIACLGRSNVGKSSLINSLAEQKNLARVSAEPGRTQHLNLFDADGRFFLVDVPGYGFANLSKTRREHLQGLIHDYLWQAHTLKLVLLIIDARLGPTDLDRDMLRYLVAARIPFIIIANKIDKLSHSETTRRLASLQASYPAINVIAHSSITHAGQRAIWQAIEQALKNPVPDHS